MPIPTIKANSVSLNTIIGRNIRPGMTPGGFSVSLPSDIARRRGSKLGEDHKQVLNAARTWLAGRMPKSEIVR